MNLHLQNRLKNISKCEKLTCFFHAKFVCERKSVC